ncbi:MAG: fimbria major subunit, partial [Bacteroides sp.]|nr:fimbria major subunit [Bacteroides sp.]
VYKLAVLNIKKLGHPRVTENDPDPVTPETPDEKDEVYLDVKVEVLPWVVRINNIEF